MEVVPQIVGNALGQRKNENNSLGNLPLRRIYYVFRFDPVGFSSVSMVYDQQYIRLAVEEITKNFGSPTSSGAESVTWILKGDIVITISTKTDYINIEKRTDAQQQTGGGF